MSRKVVQQQARVATNNKKDSLYSIEVEPVRFAILWKSYPSGQPYVDPVTGKPPRGYQNQCAIKVSLAIHGAGIKMTSFRGANVEINACKAAVRATELAAWLKRQPFCGLSPEPLDVTGNDWQAKLSNRTGIVYFENYWHRSGETGRPSGDHIDLWNGARLTASGWSIVSTLGRRIGIASLGAGIAWGYSDLGKSTAILFWDIP